LLDQVFAQDPLAIFVKVVVTGKESTDMILQKLQFSFAERHREDDVNQFFMKDVHADCKLLTFEQ